MSGKSNGGVFTFVISSSDIRQKSDEEIAEAMAEAMREKGEEVAS